MTLKLRIKMQAPPPPPPSPLPKMLPSHEHQSPCKRFLLPFATGFSIIGKQIIHPGQIDIVNKAFSPSDEKVQWARDLVNAFEEQERVGKVSLIWFVEYGTCTMSRVNWEHFSVALVFKRWKQSVPLAVDC